MLFFDGGAVEWESLRKSMRKAFRKAFRAVRALQHRSHPGGREDAGELEDVAEREHVGDWHFVIRFGMRAIIFTNDCSFGH